MNLIALILVYSPVYQECLVDKVDKTYQTENFYECLAGVEEYYEIHTPLNVLCYELGGRLSEELYCVKERL